MRYHLDTNIVSAIIRGAPKPRQISELRLGRWSISSIVYAELSAWLCTTENRAIESRLSEFLNEATVISFEVDAALEHGRIQARAKTAGRPVSDFDSLIAAHAIADGAILVTNNTKHFEHIEGLHLENWRD